MSEETIEVATNTPGEDACVCNPALRLRLDDTETARYAAAFKALSNPVRLQMLDLISQGGGQLCACDIERHFDLTQPTISHHLKVLRDAGLIESGSKGVWVLYQINSGALAGLRGLLALVNQLESE